MKAMWHTSAVILACLAMGPTATAAPPALPTPPQASTSVVPVPNLRQPREGLFTAGQPGADAWPALAAQGIATVVNLRPRSELPARDEAAEVAAAGMAYHEIPVAGAADVTEAKARELWSLLQQVPGPVLVHCSSGNRVGALLAVGAAHSGGMPAEDALALGKRAGLTGAEPRVRELLGLPPANGER